MRTSLSMSRRRRIRAGNFVSSERRKDGSEAEALRKVCTLAEGEAAAEERE